MKTPVLFDVKPDSPTKHKKLEAFKTEHHIWTYGSGKHGWDAMLIEKSRACLDGYGVTKDTSAFEMVAGYCRILEEADFLVGGLPSEIAVVRELCKLNGIHCSL